MKNIVWLLFVILVASPALHGNTTYGQTPSSDNLKGQTVTTSSFLAEIVNPVVPQRADPWVYRHTDGYYYFTASVPEYDRIEVRRAETIQGLGSASPVTVWQKHDSGMMSKHIWAPEIHYVNGKWYIYFAAARVDAPFDHRVYVLETEAANPLEGTWIEKGQIITEWETFSLDATTFEHKGVQYLVWAQRSPHIRGNSNLYIAAMSNPWTLAGPQVMLTKPEFDWEIQGFWVNEGAAVLVRNGRVFITYSASATDAHYAMGMLTASADSDLLDASSWEKSPEPIFQTNRATGQFGPGHNSFTVTPDGQDILIYHARNYERITGDPLYDPNRHTRAQMLYWSSDGTPILGVPVPDGPLPVRLGVSTIPGQFVAHDEGRVVLSEDLSRVESSQFKAVPGLADPAAVSFESIDRPGYYLRHETGAINLGENDDSADFAAAATWWQRTGLTGSGLASFEAYSAPGQYLRQQEHTLDLGAASSDAEKAAATFTVEY